MRVHVTIPGTVESYCVDERGEKRKASEELWLETYLCSVLRAYSYADDGSGETIGKIVGVRRFNPVTNTETEHRFLNSAEQLFFRGRLSEALLPSYTDLCRMATWIRFRGSGTHERFKSSDDWSSQIPRNNRAIRIWHQSVREATDAKHRGVLAPGQGLVHGA